MHAGHRQRFATVYLDDPCCRIRREHERDVLHIRADNIGNVITLADHETAVFLHTAIVRNVPKFRGCNAHADA